MASETRKERRKRQREAAQACKPTKPLPVAESIPKSIESPPTTIVNKVQNQTPSQPKAKEGVVKWVKDHKTTSSLIGLFVFSLGGLLNYFGANPRILYFPAVVFCTLICWLVMSGTHRFVQGRLNETKASAVTNTPAETKAFSVFADVQFIQLDSNTDPLIWFVRIFRDGLIRYPVFLTLHVQFTNLKPIATKIANYAVEVQNPDKSWTVIPDFDIGYGTIFVVTKGDLKAARKITCTTFNSVLREQNIAAGATVQGWIFLDVGEHGRGTNFRLRVMDTTGVTSIEPIRIYVQATKWDSSLIGGEMRAGDIVDISSVRQATSDERLTPPH
ncbi:MAG: hypothetical protein HY298_23900 [Verrucomicrobia bacterium]|nr:hypothetical protein [Verrucomicrobiota bacterium]